MIETLASQRWDHKAALRFEYEQALGTLSRCGLVSQSEQALPCGNCLQLPHFEAKEQARGRYILWRMVKVFCYYFAGFNRGPTLDAFVI